MLSDSIFSFTFSPLCRENWRVSNFEIRTGATTIPYASCMIDRAPATTREKTSRNRGGRNFTLIVKVDPVFLTQNPIGEEQFLHRNFRRFHFFERYVDFTTQNRPDRRSCFLCLLCGLRTGGSSYLIALPCGFRSLFFTAKTFSIVSRFNEQSQEIIQKRYLFYSCILKRNTLIVYREIVDEMFYRLKD